GLLRVFLPRIRLTTQTPRIPRVGYATGTQTNIVSRSSSLPKSRLLRQTEMVADMRRLGNRNFNRRNNVRRLSV
ncbi:hypothetical protein, partial [Pseudomonas syringae]